MFVDKLIPRLKAAGLTVHDIRDQLPRNGRYMARPISAIKRIAHHYDADVRPHEYDSIARYKQQAQYHINKDWGGGAHGDGLMYAVKIDNTGEVFICRDFEDVTWHVGNPNYSAVATCYDCGGDQEPTKEQILSMQKVADVLCTQCPEFPADRTTYYGHQEFKQFGGTATACPGKFMPEVVRYRTTGKVNPDLYAWDWPPTPTPTPTPPPHVPVITTEDSSETSEVAFDTFRQDDATLLKGQEKIVTEGKNGIRTKITRKTYADGNLTSQTVISDTVTTQPVTKVIAVGTKEPEPIPTPPTPTPAPKGFAEWLVDVLEQLINFLKGKK